MTEHYNEQHHEQPKVVKDLIINGEVKSPKGSIEFLKRAQEKADKSTGISGFVEIFINLLDENPLGLVTFYQCALLPKYTEATIQEAIERVVVDNNGDWKPLFRGAVQVMEHDLLLKGQMTGFWKGIEKSIEAETDEKKRETLISQRDMFQQLKNELIKGS